MQLLALYSAFQSFDTLSKVAQNYVKKANNIQKFSQTHPASSPIACSSGPLNTTGGAITLPSALMSKNIPTAAMTPLLHVQKSFVPSVAGSTEPQRSYHDRIANKHQLSVEDLITLRKRIIALRADYLELYWDFLKCHDEDHVNTKVFAKVGLSDARLDLRLLHRKIAIIMNELESENIPEAKSLEKVLSKSELKKKQNMIKHGIEKYHQACREYEDYRRRVLILRETLNSIDENRVKLVLCCSEMDALDQGVYIEPYPFEERRLRVKHSIADEARPHKRLALDQSNNPYKKKYLSNKRRRESSDVSEDAGKELVSSNYVNLLTATYRCTASIHGRRTQEEASHHPAHAFKVKQKSYPTTERTCHGKFDATCFKR